MSSLRHARLKGAVQVNRQRVSLPSGAPHRGVDSLRIRPCTSAIQKHTPRPWCVTSLMARLGYMRASPDPQGGWTTSSKTSVRFLGLGYLARVDCGTGLTAGWTAHQMIELLFQHQEMV